MKERVARTVDGLVSAARRDGSSFERLSRVAAETAAKIAQEPRPWFHVRIRPFVGLIIVAGATTFGVLTTRQVAAPSMGHPSEVAVTASSLHAPEERANAVESEEANVPSIDVRSLPSPKAVTTPEQPSEGALLHRAHAMVSTDPRQALALTVEHARRFPKGMLAEEREFIAIEALARLDGLEDARARAATFFATYPSSVYRRRVDDALVEKP